MSTEPLAERRKPDAQVEAMTTILASLTRIHEKLEEVHPAVEQINKDLKDHIRDETVLFQNAFPDGDPDGHRRAHEAQIRKAEAEAKEAEDRAEIWLAMRKKAAEMTVYALLLTLVCILAYYWNGHMPASAQITIPGLR